MGLVEEKCRGEQVEGGEEPARAGVYQEGRHQQGHCRWGEVSLEQYGSD